MANYGRLIRALFFGEMQDSDISKAFQHLLLSRGGGHDVNHLHLLYHRAAPSSFFLEILPRTTAAVC